MSTVLHDDLDAIEGAYAEPCELVFNLQATTACNFCCKHCMFACHPVAAQKQEWMSTQDIDATLELANDFQQAGHSVRINILIIGGEATLDLDTFDRFIDYLGTHPNARSISFEMTTNGWFLRSWPTLCKFAAAVSPLLSNSEMTIRISNSIYHDPFRSSVEKLIIPPKPDQRNYYTYERKAGRLEAALESPFEYWEFTAICPNCEAELYDQTCSKCGNELSEDEYFEAQDKAHTVPGHQWIETLLKACKEDRFYVDSRVSDETKVSPVGRAAKNEIGVQKVSCWDGTPKFTIAPGGKLQGICRTGGKVPIGHVMDGAWKLFALASFYIRAIERRFPGETPKRCRNCSAFAVEWLRSQKPLCEGLLAAEQKEPVLCAA